MSRLREALSQAINSVSAENGSNTPDFILAEFLCGCLTAFDAGVNRRAEWYGRHDSIGGSGADPRAPTAPLKPQPGEPKEEEWIPGQHVRGGMKAIVPPQCPATEAPALFGGLFHVREHPADTVKIPQFVSSGLPAFPS